MPVSEMTTASQASSRRLRFEKTGKAFAADFFLAFDHERQIAGQGSAGFQIGFDRFEVREILAFVVRAAARENVAAGDARLEWRRLPEFQRLRRLHVVMAINQVVRSCLEFFSRLVLATTIGWPSVAQSLVSKPMARQWRDEPFGAGVQIFFMRGWAETLGKRR